jgi:heme-degrading monooxygenase HmoA
MKKTVVLFHAPGFTSKHYEKVWDDLRAAGYENPKGLISHVGFSKPDSSWMVVDVWESPEAFKEFSKTLLPIIQKSGVNVPEPQMLPAHYVYVGQNESVPA